MIAQAEEPAGQFHNLFQSGEGFLSPSNTASTLVLVALVVLLVIALVLMRVRRSGWKTAAMASNSEDVFDRLCQANGLTTHQVYLLREMYFDLRLENPVLLFVCPQLYDEYLHALSSVRAQLIERIRDEVFALPGPSQVDTRVALMLRADTEVVELN